MELDNEKIIDNDLEKLLAILYSIPEEKIPDRFERRLSETLKEEGKSLAEEEGKSLKKLVEGHWKK